MKEIELKPCPFCGENPTLTEVKRIDGEPFGWFVVCQNPNCHFSHSLSGNFPSKKKAIKAWDKRRHL